MSFDPVTAISPLDGRYHGKVAELSAYFSEQALMKYRILIEVEWFVFLLNTVKLKGTKPVSDAEITKLRELYEYFDVVAANRVKTIEKTTNHDVKAIEYYIKENITELRCAEYAEFIHFACTSEDINNLSYSLMLRDAVRDVYEPLVLGVIQKITELGKEHKKVPLLALTHGQPASPTTVGKEFVNVAARLQRQHDQLVKQEFLGKINGAVGNFNAHISAYPKVDWLKFSQQFVEALGLTWNKYTTQIEPHDYYAEVFSVMSRINTIIIDLDRDIWTYISRAIFKQKTKKGEVGSSTMPHKVNPLDFENSEGNAGMANAIMRFFSEKLPVSRMQRDLTDSTVQRNIGLALGYSIIAYKATIKGLGKLEINPTAIHAEFDRNWAILAEPVQTVLRKHKVAGAYELLKDMTRGKNFGPKDYKAFVKKLTIPTADKNRLMKLTPETYIGRAIEFVNEYK